MGRAGVILVFVLASFIGASAQDLPLQPGQRVRVTASRPDRRAGLTGSFQALRGDTMVVLYDSPAEYGLQDVARVEVLRSESFGVVRGAVLGGLAGGTLGVLVGTAVGHFKQAQDYVIEYAANGGLVGLSVGLVVGGVWGGLSRTTRWRDVSLDRLRVSVVPHRDGVGLGARIAF